MAETQSYKNHVRWHAPFHFVLSPILAGNLIFAIVRIVQDFNIDRVAYLIVAIALILLGLFSRMNALKAQDRVIRLEEKLRYSAILSPELAKKAGELKTGQMIALRFAGDDELAELIERTLNNEFTKPDQIKRAIKNWRGDYLRV